jgi:hypothetical protein
MRPIALSDDEMNHIYQACGPLAVDQRDGFLRALAAELQGQEIGPGSVGRAIARVQRLYYDPPLERVALGPRHSQTKLNSAPPVGAEGPRTVGRQRAQWAQR